MYRDIGGRKQEWGLEKQNNYLMGLLGFPGGTSVKNLPATEETYEVRVQSLGWEDPLEECMATHSSILAWRVPVDRRA